jgi:Homing endonuclease associated repeat
MDKTKHNNGRRHSEAVHEKVRKMRIDGKTHREITKELGVSLGSANLWTRGIVLSPEQKAAIHEHEVALRRLKITPEYREHLREHAKKYLWKEKYTDEDLISKIQNFYHINGRIPLKREFNALKIYRDRFGSWNNAIRLAGFEPNPVLFAKRFIANDGHQCDSFSEKIIDDYLAREHILHTRNVPYEGTRMTADFGIETNIILEFFGLAGVQHNYDRLVNLKREHAKQKNILLIEVYPEDIFPVNTLDRVLSFGILEKLLTYLPSPCPSRAF